MKREKGVSYVVSVVTAGVLAILAVPLLFRVFLS